MTLRPELWWATEEARFTHNVPVTMDGGWPSPYPTQQNDKAVDQAVRQYGVNGIKGERWRLDAQCAGEAPQLWETDFYGTQTSAVWDAGFMLCDGCPVLRECAQSALRPVTAGGDFQTGVIRAGVPMGFSGDREALQRIAVGKVQDDVRERIIAQYQGGLSQAEVAKRNGISQTTVSRIVTDAGVSQAGDGAGNR